MTAKLHINISQGVLDIEGDPDLVREIYTDFKGQLLASVTGRNPSPDLPESLGSTEDGAKTRVKGRRKASSRKRGNGDEVGSDVNADAPKLDRDLDTSKLAAFYGQYEPKNHPEKILIFLMFLTDELGIKSPNTDQVYTCYTKANERVPKAFAQAFYDTSGRSAGYIEYKSATEIRITTAGLNHFKFDLSKKGGE
jgi:hypothetical protein